MPQNYAILYMQRIAPILRANFTPNCLTITMVVCKYRFVVSSITALGIEVGLNLYLAPGKRKSGGNVSFTNVVVTVL